MTNSTTAASTTVATTGPAVDVRNLKVDILDRSVDVVDEVSLQIAPGEVLGLVGESGCGKTTVGMALLGYTRSGAGIIDGEILIDDVDIMGLSEPELYAMRGHMAAYIPQDPPTALNPVLHIGTQLWEMLDTHLPEMSTEEKDARLREVLREVSLPDDDEFLSRYPHQLSGGQQQRIVIAMAFLCRPYAIVCDEPTTGLDVTTQAQVLETIRALARYHDSAVLYVSHDLAVVSSLADRVAVMYSGRVVEVGTRDQVFNSPAHPYTRQLMMAAPDIEGKSAPLGIDGSAPLPGGRPFGCFYAPRCPWVTEKCLTAFPPETQISTDHMARCYHLDEGLSVPWKPGDVERMIPGERILTAEGITASYSGTPVVHDINFEMKSHQCLAVVGESGSGKTTLARCVVGLHREYRGTFKLQEEELAHLARKRSDEERRRIQYVFQNPYASLNPRRTIADSIAAPLKLFGKHSKSEIDERVAETIERVSLSTSAAYAYPSLLSGGERQRAAIARALIAEPEVLVCDEITSALDASVQAAIIDLLGELQKEMGLSLLFITHNLAVIRIIADSVIVINQGHLVETAATEDLFLNPKDDYTKALIKDTPRLVLA